MGMLYLMGVCDEVCGKCWLYVDVTVGGGEALARSSPLADIFASALLPCAPTHVNGHTLLPCSPLYVNVPYHHVLHCTYTNVAASRYMYIVEANPWCKLRHTYFAKSKISLTETWHYRIHFFIN